MSGVISNIFLGIGAGLFIGIPGGFLGGKIIAELWYNFPFYYFKETTILCSVVLVIFFLVTPSWWGGYTIKNTLTKVGFASYLVSGAISCGCLASFAAKLTEKEALLPLEGFAPFLNQIIGFIVFTVFLLSFPVVHFHNRISWLKFLFPPQTKPKEK